MPTKKKHNPHARFYGLISQMKGAYKDDLVWNYSHKLTTSLSEFLEKRPADYQRMINDMQQTVDNMPIDSKNKAAYIIERELKKRRSAILLRLQKMGIDTTDWKVVNKFMRNPKIAGKTLGEMDTDEMDLLIPKLESILAKDKADRLKNLAQVALFSLN